ncbi:hypothetical protein DRW03_23705 [Corallococcus sp. H22C18031201]|uniref:hypothetical protein n=1 Tax=Citreicoccus inhibens TaxID=2849499 RepID=UPI000E7101E7|nr:hypothetical protein [Citreicoccus inhibens]MBU8896614.1 hypothetical protein [Citreicoccus inhibens]RJS18684.1 hypothetical protein DRW03_23705 [Corallococcus sp. H22C18031201]
MLRTVTAAAAVLGLAVGCAPNDPAPVKVRALVRSSNGQYAPKEVELTTIEDIVGLKGTVADFQGGARIVIDPNDPELATATEATLPDILIKESGHDVSASYINQGGVLWPADFHTWNMVTAYYNLEKANEYFRTVANVKVADFGPAPTVHYFPDFIQTQVSKEPGKDNAIFYSPLRAFLVLPFDQIERAPLPLNAGIMAHEYSHHVFNRLAYAGQRLPEVFSIWASDSPSPGANIVKALDEGLADYHAYGSTCLTESGCDTRFMSTSFEGPFTDEVERRDLARADRCLDATLLNNLYSMDLSTWSGNGYEYRLGTILATALYQAGQSTNQQKVLMRAVASAYNDDSTVTPGLYQVMKKYQGDQNSFTLAEAMKPIISHLTDTDLKKAVCNQLMDHLQISPDQLTGTNLCPPSAAGGNKCPRING